MTRAGVRCSNQFGRIYDHRRPRFGFGGQDSNPSHRTSSSSTGSPPPSPSSPSATSIHARRLPDHLDSGYTTPSKSVNLLANVPQKSETVKKSRPIVAATASLPLQPDVSSQSMYATIGARHSNPMTQFVHPNYATSQRRTSPTEERRLPTVSLVTTSTSNPSNEGTLQKDKRIYL